MADEPTDAPERAQDAPESAQPAERTVTLTQAELDKQFQERVARERRKYADYEDLKKKASEFDSIQEAQKTELQKAQDRAAELERLMETAKQQAQESLLRSSVVAEAARRNVVDPDAAVALIDRSSLQFDESGQPTNVGEALDALIQAKSYLVRPARPASADQGARGSSPEQISRDMLSRMSPEEIVKAQRAGHLDSLLNPAA